MDTFETMQKADLVAHFAETKMTVASTVKAFEKAQSLSPSLSKATKQEFLRKVGANALHQMKSYESSIMTRFLNIGVVVSKLGGCPCHGIVLHICCAEDVENSHDDATTSKIFSAARDFHFENVQEEHEPEADPTEIASPFKTWGAPSKTLN